MTAAGHDPNVDQRELWLTAGEWDAMTFLLSRQRMDWRNPIGYVAVEFAQATLRRRFLYNDRAQRAAWGYGVLLMPPNIPLPENNPPIIPTVDVPAPLPCEFMPFWPMWVCIALVTATNSCVSPS